jgi:phosphoserine phosphatase
MRSVLTLIADPATARLTPETAEDIARALRHVGGSGGVETGAIDWLAPGIACDIPFEAEPETAWRDAACRAAGDRPIDVVVQAAAHRRKTLLVADMEATIIVNEMLDELAAALGIGPRIADITRRAMNGEIRFQDALRERVALLAGLDEKVLNAACDRIVFNPGAATLIATLRARGVHCALVSGGFRVFTGYVAPRLGFEWHYANELVIRNGTVAGTVADPILGREAKRDTLLRLCRDLGIEQADTLAVGDGANDIDMIEAAGLGVAFRAKPALQRVAPASIRHGDLTALLYLQGYRQSEFAAA